MAGRTLQLRADDGIGLSCIDWPVASATGHGVVIMHGLGEHAGRYEHIARFFNELGWSVRAYDHRGHGRSGGARGDTPDDVALLRDAKRMVEDFARQTGASPPATRSQHGRTVCSAFCHRIDRAAARTCAVLARPRDFAVRCPEIPA